MLLTAAAVIMTGFPGLFTCLQMKRKYKNLDRSVQAFVRQAVPSDFRAWELRGLRLSAPADYALRESSDGSLCGEDGKVRIVVTRQEAGALSAFYDSFEDYDFTESDLRHYFESVGRPYRAPFNNALLYYCKDELSVWDGLRLRGSDRKVFSELCEIKDGSWDAEETLKAEIPGGIAYISSGAIGGLQTVTMYPEKGSIERIVYVKEPDAQKAAQIISSFAFAESGT